MLFEIDVNSVICHILLGVIDRLIVTICDTNEGKNVIL